VKWLEKEKERMDAELLDLKQKFTRCVLESDVKTYYELLKTDAGMKYRIFKDELAKEVKEQLG